MQDGIILHQVMQMVVQEEVVAILFPEEAVLLIKVLMVEVLHIVEAPIMEEVAAEVLVL